MMSSPGKYLLLAGAAMLAGCGARQAQPVAGTSPLDDRLSCEHIQGERAANQVRLAELSRETERRQQDNVGMILGFGLVGLAFADTGEAQRQESAALAGRNNRLDQLAVARNCRT